MVPIADVWMGQSISGYVITEKIGSGAFGKLYRASKPGQAEVAVKVQHASQSGYFESEVYRELSTHKHFPTWYLFHSFDSYTFIVVALGHKDLARLQNLNHPREYRPTTVQVIAHQMMSALAFLHYRNIVHGDIKPSNIVLAPPKGRENVTRIWIIDFGIAVRNEKKGVQVCANSFEYSEYSLSSPYIAKNGTPKDRDDAIQMTFCLLALSGHNLNELNGTIEAGNVWKRSILSDPASTLDPEFEFLFNYLRTVGEQPDDVVDYKKITKSIAEMLPETDGTEDLKMVNKGDGLYRLY